MYNSGEASGAEQGLTIEFPLLDFSMLSFQRLGLLVCCLQHGPMPLCTYKQATLKAVASFSGLAFPISLSF